MCEVEGGIYLPGGSPNCTITGCAAKKNNLLLTSMLHLVCTGILLVFDLILSELTW